jgi:pyruvate formate lyase activating enzyme
MLPYLSSAAIDLKATPTRMGEIMRIPTKRGVQFYQRSLRTQKLISHGSVLLDVRTPIFGDTSKESMRKLAFDITRVNDTRYTFWTWRLYKPVKGCEFPVPDRDHVLEMMKEVSAEIPGLWLGLRAKWVAGGMVFIKDGEIVSMTPDADKGPVDLEHGSGNI